MVAFDPGNVTLADQFRSIHGTGPDVVLVGPFGGQFDNGGESVTLRAPSDPPVGELGRQCPMEIRTQTANGIDFLNWQQTYSGSSSSDVMAEIIAAPQGRVGKTLAGDGDTHARRTTRLASSRLQPHMPLFQNGPFLRHPRIATHSDSLARLRDRTTDVHAWDTALLKTLDQEFLP